MRPFMPPREDLEPYLQRIWESRQLTNNGPIHEEFERALCRYLGVEHICLFANGTLALLIALKTLGLKGEVITTPFTSAATIQAIRWNNLSPVFVDIGRTDLNIHPDRIEAAFTPDTCAILPVHVYGNPCDVYGIGELAKRHHLMTVYDAAPCFGVKLNGIPVCGFGDLAVLSFHATKVFNSFEGGAIICHDSQTKERIDALKNLKLGNGLDNLCLGLNAKMNEIQAAFGLVQLNHVARVIRMRKEAASVYMEMLSGIRGIRLPQVMQGVEYNYTYFPVTVDPDEFGTGRNELAAHLENRGIVTRKYFHPLASEFPEFSGFKKADLPVAAEIATRILCLPMFHDISREEIRFISNSIREFSGGVP
jgi:dTDP-4-amino-4,6-dideoxygalactose transaminase